MLATGAGAGLAHALRPAARDLPQAIFNASQTTLQTAAGAAIIAAAHWTHGVPLDKPGQLLPVAAVAAVRSRRPVSRDVAVAPSSTDG